MIQPPLLAPAFTWSQLGTLCAWILLIWILSHVRVRPRGKRVWCNGTERKGWLFWRSKNPLYLDPKWTLVKKVNHVFQHGEIYDLQFTLTLVIDRIDVYAHTNRDQMEDELARLLQEHAHRMEVWQFEHILVEFFHRHGLQVHVESQKHMLCSMTQRVKERMDTFIALEQEYPQHRDTLLQIFQRCYQDF